MTPGVPPPFFFKRSYSSYSHIVQDCGNFGQDFDILEAKIITQNSVTFLVAPDIQGLSLVTTKTTSGAEFSTQRCVNKAPIADVVKVN